MLKGEREGFQWGQRGNKMVSNNQDDILSELEYFLIELEEYKSLLEKPESEADKRDLIFLPKELQHPLKGLPKKDKEELRKNLVRKSGALKTIIIELTRKKYITRFGIVHNIWDVALTAHRVSDICDVALDYCIDAVNEAIGKLETTPPSEIAMQEVTIKEPPKAFIAHGGESPALDKLKKFLIALGVEPLVIEEQPSEGRSVGENVDCYARQADCAIILATKGDIDGKTGRFIPRGNVLIEIGKSQELFKDRIIYLLQAGANLPTNITEKVRARFTTQNMDNAFIKVATELRKFGILKAIKPQVEEQT